MKLRVLVWILNPKPDTVKPDLQREEMMRLEATSDCLESAENRPAFRVLGLGIEALEFRLRV